MGSRFSDGRKHRKLPPPSVIHPPSTRHPRFHSPESNHKRLRSLLFNFLLAWPLSKSSCGPPLSLSLFKLIWAPVFAIRVFLYHCLVPTCIVTYYVHLYHIMMLYVTFWFSSLNNRITYKLFYWNLLPLDPGMSPVSRVNPVRTVRSWWTISYRKLVDCDEELQLWIE